MKLIRFGVKQRQADLSRRRYHSEVGILALMIERHHDQHAVVRQHWANNESFLGCRSRGPRRKLSIEHRSNTLLKARRGRGVQKKRYGVGRAPSRHIRGSSGVPLDKHCFVQVCLIMLYRQWGLILLSCRVETAAAYDDCGEHEPPFNREGLAAFLVHIGRTIRGNVAYKVGTVTVVPDDVFDGLPPRAAADTGRPGALLDVPDTFVDRHLADLTLHHTKRCLPRSTPIVRWRTLPSTSGWARPLSSTTIGAGGMGSVSP